MQYLMLETKDQRRFFTHRKNLPMLIEFSNTFGADISIVKAKDVDVLELDKLVPAICDANFKQDPSNYQVVEKKISHRKPKEKGNASKIRKYIKDMFLSGELVQLHDVADHFKNCNLSLTCFCNHMSQTRRELQKEGHSFVKIGGGKYKLE